MSLLDPIKDYYTTKLEQYGASPSGVDWNGEASQRLRFESLSRVINVGFGEAFSLDDYGCGYGAYLAYLNERGWDPDYLGLDVSPQMVEAAVRLHPKGTFAVGTTSPRVADYAVASGIFNVALDINREAWLRYTLDTLDAMHASTTRGFSFNCLTSFSDPQYMRSHLYYSDPCFFFKHCKERYSRQVALLHDYGLYEFTIIVRKDL